MVVVPGFLPWDNRWMFLVGFSMVDVAGATILTAALHRSQITLFLSSPAFVWIGRRSYGLYLWHYPIMLVGLLYFKIPQGILLTVIEVLAAFILASLSYRFIEGPLLKRRYARPLVDAVTSRSA